MAHRSVLDIAPEIRMSIYQEYLGNRSMSIALMRQTCRKIRAEIESAMRPARYCKHNVALFEHTIDMQKLHGCSLETIEGCMPNKIEVRNVDVSTWDFLFANAIDSKNEQDIDRLLDMFVYPLSSVLVCSHEETAMREMLNSKRVQVKANEPVFDNFVTMVASRGKETIQKYYQRLPCQCVKMDFVYSAIKRSLIVVLETLSINLAELNFVRICKAVGDSGSIEMFDYIQGRLCGFQNHHFDRDQSLAICFMNAACLNDTHLLEHIFCIHGEIRLQLGTWSRMYSDNAVEFVMRHITSADWSANQMPEAARLGNASVFQRLIALQPDPSCTEWHKAFDNFAKQVPLSLANALMRSAEDMTYFCVFFGEIMPAVLLEPVKPSFGLGPPVAMWTAILHQTKLRIDASQMIVLLEHMLTFANANPRNLLLDCLWFLVKSNYGCFRLDLAEIIMQFSIRLELAPLQEDEGKSLAVMAVDDDAFEWVCDCFNVTITPDEATSLLRTADSSMRPNVWRRLISLGAKVEHGIYLFADLMWLRQNMDEDYNPHENVHHRHLERLCKILIDDGEVRPFRRIFVAASRGHEWAKVMLGALEAECTRSLMCRERETGCLLYRLDMTLPVRDSTHPLTSCGYMRLYHQACEWFNITPLDPSNISFKRLTYEVALV